MSKAAQQTMSSFNQLAYAIIDDVKKKFNSLSPGQINWKPAPDKWSVGQCLDHLIVANTTYFPIFEKIAQQQYKQPLIQGIPIISGMIGKLVVKVVSPESMTKAKAPKIFTPSNSNIGADIVEQFVRNQQQVIAYLDKMKNVDADKLTIYSPVSNLVTYSLKDGLQIIFNHEQRHILQAERLLSLPEFPKN